MYDVYESLILLCLYFTSYSVTFELKHNVCGRRIYAEGTVDAVMFLDDLRPVKPSKRLYNMIDVLESGKMKWYNMS